MTKRHRRFVREALATVDQRIVAVKDSIGRLKEVGRVISAANEDKLRTAMQALADVLKGLEDKSQTAESRAKTAQLAESYSSAADDASSGAYILAMLLNVMGEEADEPGDLAILQVAYQSIVQWMAIEVGEIGTPVDSTDLANDVGGYDSISMAMEGLARRRRLRGAAIRSHSTGTTDAEWDADAAQAALPEAPSEETLRSLYAYNDPEGDPTTQAAYKYPHHTVSDGTVGAANVNACQAAIATLNGGRGGSDIPDDERSAVYAHLAAHLNDAGVEPAELAESWRVMAERIRAAGIGPRMLREAKRVESSIVPLKERAVNDNGDARIKLIQPGWGSTGYYSAEVLEQGAHVFPAGTKMFWDHATLTEELERPERSLRDLAGVTTSDAVWDPEGPQGAGLYADVNVFGPYREVLDEIAPSIGVSIVAYGTAENGTAEGKSGQLIKELVAADSVDYVTTPGAGGAVMSLFESVRQQATNHNPGQEVENVDLEKDPRFVAERQAKEAAEGELVSLKAGETIAKKLSESQLPELTRKRLGEQLKQSPPVKDGKLDAAALSKRVDEAVEKEQAYLDELNKTGEIRGMGATGAAGAADAAKQEAELEEAFKRTGMSEKGAKLAAAGRK